MELNYCIFATLKKSLCQEEINEKLSRRKFSQMSPFPCEREEEIR